MKTSFSFTVFDKNKYLVVKFYNELVVEKVPVAIKE